MSDTIFTRKVILTRKAKGAGGDRYETDDLNIYVPHEISRGNKSEPVQNIEVTFRPIIGDSK